MASNHALPLRFELLALAQKVGNLAEDAAGTPVAGILLALNRDMHAAVRAVDKLPLPLNVELLGMSPAERAAADRLVANVAENFTGGPGPLCDDCGGPIDDGYCLACGKKELTKWELARRIGL